MARAIRIHSHNHLSFPTQCVRKARQGQSVRPIGSLHPLPAPRHYNRSWHAHSTCPGGRAVAQTADIFEQAIDEHLKVIQSLHDQVPLLNRIASRMSRTILDGGTILWCGNGGSAADAQHLAAELVGRFLQERRGLPSIALTTNTSILTSISNDYGYENVFRRQVE